MSKEIRTLQYLSGVISEQAFYETIHAEKGPFSPEAAALMDDIKNLLQSEDVGGDIWFYGQQAWHSRGEEVGHESELTMAAEGELYRLLNHGGFARHLREVAERRGFEMEQGKHYTWHFYKKQPN
jgi:hypothetical protein